jgi:hypothetical protein
MRSRSSAVGDQRSSGEQTDSSLPPQRARWCSINGALAVMPGWAYVRAFGFPPAGGHRLQQKCKDTVPAALEDRVDLTPELIRTVVRQGCPSCHPRKTEVTDADLDAVIVYLTQKRRK